MCLAAAALIFHQREGERLLPGMLMMVITFFAISQGRLIWVYVRELFPDHLGTQGQSLTLLVCLFTSALVSGLFPALRSSSAAVPFAFFALVMAVQFLMVLLVYPETKAELAEELGRNMEPGPAAPQP
jgi:SP family arabinose:H+ symporter-like MFS transporter